MHIDPLQIIQALEAVPDVWDADPIVFRGPGLTLTLDDAEDLLEVRLEQPEWEVVVRLHGCEWLEVDLPGRCLRSTPDERGRRLQLSHFQGRYELEIEQTGGGDRRGFRQAAFADFPADEVELDDGHEDGWFVIRRGEADVRVYLSGCSYLADIRLSDAEGTCFSLALEEVHDARWTGERLEIEQTDRPDILIYPGERPRIEVG